jgi:hypothetical protein
MVKVLPPQRLQGATLRANEYGWSVAAFPDALAEAEGRGYACLGGQFQFRLDEGGTCEMYRLNADSKDRAPGESWADYCHRSCVRFETGFSVWLTRQISASRHRVGGYQYTRQAARGSLRILSQRPTWKCRSDKVGSAMRETTSRPAGRRSKLPARTLVAQVGKGNFGLIQDDGVFLAYFCATNCFARLSSGRVEFEPSQTFSNSA